MSGRDTVWVSFARALDGLALALHQRNLRIHLAAAVGVVSAGLFLNLSPWQWLAVFSAVFLVMVAEIFNSSIEAVVDLVTRERRPLAGAAKDMAAGAVLLASFYALVVAGAVFVPAAAGAAAMAVAQGGLAAGFGGVRLVFLALFLLSAVAVFFLLFQRGPLGRGKRVTPENWSGHGQDSPHKG